MCMWGSLVDLEDLKSPVLPLGSTTQRTSGRPEDQVNGSMYS